MQKREDMGDLVKLAGALAIFAVTFVMTVAAFFNLGPLERFRRKPPPILPRKAQLCRGTPSVLPPVRSGPAGKAGSWPVS